MLDLDPNRQVATPVPAATLLLLRDRGGALEVFVIVRHPKSTFLGGAIAFPGGKVDKGDADPRWDALTTAPSARLDEMHALAPLPVSPRTIAIAACRESLEEAALVPAKIDGAAALALREDLRGGKTFIDLAAEKGLQLELAELVPFARWVTPTAEARRYDTVFFVALSQSSQVGVYDRHETTDAYWATPDALFAKWAANEVQIWPPTVRCLELLQTVKTTAEAIALANAQNLAPICPELAAGETPTLVLPGDPLHSQKTPIVLGNSRFVMRDGRFQSTNP